MSVLTEAGHRGTALAPRALLSGARLSGSFGTGSVFVLILFDGVPVTVN